MEKWQQIYERHVLELGEDVALAIENERTDPLRALASVAVASEVLVNA